MIPLVLLQPPSPSGEIEITEPILLNTETGRLTKVVIGNGGRLVFDPSVRLSKITAGRITIEDGGYLDIGSSDCPFTGNAEILLTGLYKEDILTTLLIHNHPKRPT